MTEADEIRTALAANDAFYETFVRGRYERMDQLWATTTPVICIHPGSPAIHGRAGVMESWRQVLESPPRVSATDARAEIIRGVAVVTCLEHIDGSVLAATNLFVWENGTWAIAHHQAGPVRREPETEPEPRGPLH